VPPRGTDEAPDVALTPQQIIVIDKPRARARHQLGVIEHRGGFAPQIGDETAFRMLARFRSAERAERGRLMVKQCASPPIKRPNRGNPRRGASELAAEMFQHSGWDNLDRIERPAGHLEEADLKAERQPVPHPPPSADGGKLVLAEREELFDLHR